MKTENVLNVVHLFTSLAVLGGLVLVTVELKQARDIASVQQTSDLRAGFREVGMAEIGEELPTALAKACEAPESLTSAELMALNGYFISQTYLVIRGYREETYDIEHTVAGFGAGDFSSDPFFSARPGVVESER